MSKIDINLSRTLGYNLIKRFHINIFSFLHQLSVRKRPFSIQQHILMGNIEEISEDLTEKLLYVAGVGSKRFGLEADDIKFYGHGSVTEVCIAISSML